MKRDRMNCMGVRVKDIEMEEGNDGVKEDREVSKMRRGRGLFRSP